MSDETITKLRDVNIPVGQKNVFTGLNALLIWQYVRMNPLYQKEFDKLRGTRNKRALAEEAFCMRWGIAEPYNYRKENILGGYTFQKHSVYSVNYEDDVNHGGQVEALAWTIQNQRSTPETQVLLLLIDQYGDKKMILNEVRKVIDEWIPDTKNKLYRIKGSAQHRFTDNLACFYFNRIKKLTPSKVSEKLKTLLNINYAELQSHQLADKVKTFCRWSESSPGIFFRAKG